ncbi:MAG TPA: hypothetical protein VMU59_11395 [Caulobacteraceae bacterium]|nr:hypothetical protein [Caulobacteraceae bacterium]
MERIDTSNVALNLFGPGKNGFLAGNPTSGILATKLSALWFNNIQEELCSFIEAQGLALNAGDFTQLAQAVTAVALAKAAAAQAAAAIDAQTRANTAYTNAYNNAVAWASGNDVNVQAYARGLIDGMEQPQASTLHQYTGVGGGTLTPYIGFTTAIGGLLTVFCGRNNAAAFSVSQPLSIYLNGTMVDNASTPTSSTCSWAGAVGAGSYTLGCNTSGNQQFDAYTTFTFVPYRPTY